MPFFTHMCSFVSLLKYVQEFGSAHLNMCNTHWTRLHAGSLDIVVKSYVFQLKFLVLYGRWGRSVASPFWSLEPCLPAYLSREGSAISWLANFMVRIAKQETKETKNSTTCLGSM